MSLAVLHDPMPAHEAADVRLPDDVRGRTPDDLGHAPTIARTGNPGRPGWWLRGAGA